MNPGEIAFLNVDLDIESPSGFDAINAGFKGIACDLHEGMPVRPDPHRASYEVETDQERLPSPAARIEAFCDAIESFPLDARRQWDAATQRVYNIGINSGTEPYHKNWTLPQSLVQRIARVGAAIELTVYRVDDDNGDSRGMLEEE